MGNLEQFEIDWDKVEVVNFAPVPIGDYAAKVIESEVVTTAKKFKMVKLTFELLGKNAGRRIYETYLLTHSNPKAVQTAQGKLKSLGEAIGVDFDELEDTTALHGIPVGIKVKIEKSEGYDDKNKITSFFEYDDSLLDGVDKENIDVTPEPDDKEPSQEKEVFPNEKETEKEVAVKDISTMTMKELKELAIDYDLDLKLFKGLKVKEVRKAIYDLLQKSTVDNNDDDEEIFVG